MIQKILRHSLILSSLAIITAIAITGCSSSTTPTTTTTTTNNNVYPAKGSSFQYTITQTDSTGKPIGSILPVNATVIDSGKTFFSQSNSYTIADDAGDTTHYAYSDGNDALTYIENSGASAMLVAAADSTLRRWITLSISSHASGVVVIDSMPVTIIVSSFPIPTKIHMITNYIGSDSVQLASGTSLFVQHCQLIATASAAISAIPITYTRDIYFAPKLGTFAKETTFAIIPSVLGLAGNKGGTVQVMTSYTLK